MPESHLLFHLGAHTLALPLLTVSSVERPGRFTQLPFAVPWMRGVTAVRGAVVSVVDLGRFAGGDPAGLSPGARLLVTRGAGVTAALLVDGVGRIGVAAPTRSIRQGHNGPLAPWYRGALDLDGQEVPVLDPDLLLASRQFTTYQQPAAE